MLQCQERSLQLQQVYVGIIAIIPLCILFRFKTQFYKALGFKPALEVARREKFSRSENMKNHVDEPNELYNPFRKTVAVNIDSTSTEKQHGCNNNNEKRLDKAPNQRLTQSRPEFCDAESPSIQQCSQCEFTESDERVVNTTSYLRIILDMSACSFIDNDGVKTLNTLFSDLSKLQIQLVLARSSGKFFLISSLLLLL